MLTKSFPIGESTSYMISAITLQNHFSLDIRESDVKQARKDFPNHYKNIRHAYIAEQKKLCFFWDKNGTRYSWYMGTYSLVSIPMKILLKFLHLNQAYAFQITNVLFYIFSLLLVFYKLKTSEQKKLITYNIFRTFRKDVVALQVYKTYNLFVV